MDEKLSKAFEVANYMATLSAQRRIILEELNQKLVHYVNGGTFKITTELITFTKTLLDLGQEADVVFIDANNMPVVIVDVQDFFDTIVSKYFESINEYSAKYNDIKSKRKVQDIVSL
jgi:hypothetical protein